MRNHVVIYRPGPHVNTDREVAFRHQGNVLTLTVTVHRREDFLDETFRENVKHRDKIQEWFPYIRILNIQ